ncbi:MAG TPA: AAA family ATPase [Bryobacteraceae bacterium]|jgi:predicted ATP-dependent endonuclease of OLD family|nr:AAA family ATPase [Bryobacteraceae bacterium]
MYLSQVITTNFRNFKSVDSPLGKHAVLLGENDDGKTNLLHVLRLILHPSMPDSA